MSESEYFQSSRPGLEDMVAGRIDPLALYTDLGLTVMSLYADTAKEIGETFALSTPSGDLNTRADALRKLVQKAGVPLTETRAEKKMEEVYEALKTKVLPERAKTWDAQDVLASNALLRRLRLQREMLLNQREVNAEILAAYGVLFGFMAKVAPPPFSKALKSYYGWFSSVATMTIEQQLAAVTAEIPKVEKQHQQILKARTERRLAAERKRKADEEKKREQEKKKQAEAEAQRWRMYGFGAAVGLTLWWAFRRGTS